VGDGGSDPCADVEGAALVAGGAEVAGFAGEGEQVLVAATGAEESGEAGGEVAAAEEALDMGDGVGTQGAHGGPVMLFVAGGEIVPAMVNQLPEGRSTGAAGFWAGRIYRNAPTDDARSGKVWADASLCGKLKDAEGDPPDHWTRQRNLTKAWSKRLW
jgi:hypothetical protein